jgi:hypothetical protein
MTKFDEAVRVGVFHREGLWDRRWTLLGTVGSRTEAKRLVARLTHGKRNRAARELWCIAPPHWRQEGGRQPCN